MTARGTIAGVAIGLALLSPMSSAAANKDCGHGPPVFPGHGDPPASGHFGGRCDAPQPPPPQPPPEPPGEKPPPGPPPQPPRAPATEDGHSPTPTPKRERRPLRPSPAPLPREAPPRGAGFIGGTVAPSPRDEPSFAAFVFSLLMGAGAGIGLAVGVPAGPPPSFTARR